MDNPNKHLVHYRSVLRTLSDIFYVAFSEDVKDLTVKDGHWFKKQLLNLHGIDLWNRDKGIMQIHNIFSMYMIPYEVFPIITTIAQKFGDQLLPKNYLDWPKHYCNIDSEVLFPYVR